VKKISFGDKDYVKASEIAKRFKYTQDYVGQLCRSGKVDSRLVGRTWYVVPESVTSYRKTKHKTQRTTQPKIVKAASGRPKKKISVKPVLRGKTAKGIAAKPSTRSRVSAAVSYSPDTVSHIPILQPAVTTGSEPSARSVGTQKLAKPRGIRVVPHSKKKTLLSAEKIPEITLSGKLKIKSTNEIEVESGVPDQESATVDLRRNISTQSSSTGVDAGVVTLSSVTKPDIEGREATKGASSSQNQPKERSLPTKANPWVRYHRMLSVILVLLACMIFVLVLGAGTVHETSTDSSQNFVQFSMDTIVTNIKNLAR